MDPLTGFEEDEAFFQRGEALVHEGELSGMRSLAPVELELESGSLLVTPEQLARAGRFRKPVALLVGGLGLLSLLALATHRQKVELTADGALPAQAAQPGPPMAHESPLAESAPLAVPLAEPAPLTEPAPPLPTPAPALPTQSLATALASPMSSARSGTLSIAKQRSASINEVPVSVPGSTSAALPALPASARFPDLPR